MRSLLVVVVKCLHLLLSIAVVVVVARAGAEEPFVIDQYEYHPPFDTTQYPAPVAAVLQTRIDDSDPLSEATWYADLGGAHQTVAELQAGEEEDDEEEDATTTTTTTTKNILLEHLQKGVAATRRSAILYQGLLLDVRTHPDQATYATEVALMGLLASSYFQLSDLYWLEGTVDGLEMSLEHNQKAHDLYYRLIDQRKNELSQQELDHFEVGWARCLLRRGSALFSQATGKDKNQQYQPVDIDQEKMNKLLRDNMDLVEELAGGDVELLEQSLTMILEAGHGTMIAQQEENTKKAIEYFHDADAVFSRAIDRERDREEQRNLKLLLVSTLQRLGSALVVTGDLNLSAKHNERAFRMYEDLLALFEGDGSSPVDIADSRRGACEVLYSLADIYMQTNSFELSKDRYRLAMDWFQAYNVDPPAQTPLLTAGTVDLSTQIQEYERLLEEYHESIATDDVAQYDHDGYLDGGEGYAVKDDGYEADIHIALGTLYTTQGEDYVMAAIHLEQATRLYEVTGERQTVNMATAKFDLAFIYLQNKEYEKSAIAHAEAVDLFRATGATSKGGSGMGFSALASLIALAQDAVTNDASSDENDVTTDSPHIITDEGSGKMFDLQGFFDQNETVRDEL